MKTDKTLTDNKIRFIDTNYNELFTINDGDEIIVKYESGEVNAKTCHYIDDYHTKIGGKVYHIHEFAEMMERNSNKYEPSILNDRSE